MIGETFGTWRVVAHVEKRTWTVRCVHCGVEKPNSAQNIRASAPWHWGCPVKDRHATKRKTRNDNRIPAGDDPRWATWSLMLHMGDPACAKWSKGRIENVRAWRSNQVDSARVFPIEFYAGRKVNQ